MWTHFPDHLSYRFTEIQPLEPTRNSTADDPDSLCVLFALIARRAGNPRVPLTGPAISRLARVDMKDAEGRRPEASAGS